VFKFRANGDNITVPAHNVEIATPKIGDVVTCVFESNSQRKMTDLNVEIVKCRKDISWEDVVHNYHKLQNHLNGKL
jgi:hypothetical protein